MTTQVLVVGAGPVGLTMAGELARYGVPVRIVDKAAARTDKSKALVLWSRTLELLERTGSVQSFIAAGRKIDAANIVAGSELISQISIATVASPYPFALMLPQSETERLLEGHLNGLGVSVERQVEVTSFTQTGSGARAILKHADGREETVDSEWLIGCDGAHSTIRHGLGLSFAGETMPSTWVLADCLMQGYPFPDSEMAAYWHEDGVLVIFPITPGRFRIIANVELPAGAAPAEPTLAEIQAILDRRGPGGMALSNPFWLSPFRINERMVEKYRSGRVFVAGDAAHVHSPAGGQGMNTGMQDAFNLAWKLALVCRGTCPEGQLLDSYSAERSAIGADVLSATGRMTTIAVLKNHTAQTIRNFIGHLLLGLAPLRRAIVDSMTEVSLGYRHSPLNGPRAHGLGKPQPGSRAVPIAGQTPAGSGTAPRFVLCAAPSGATERLLAKYSALVEPTVRPPLGPEGQWLVRPDGYVACVAKRGDEQTIADYLEGMAT